MAWHDLFVAGALMLVLEGILPILSPRAFRQAMLKAAQMNDQQVRWTGLISMVMGALLIYWLKN